MVFTSANSAFAVGCGWTLFWFFCHNGQGELCRIGVEAGPVDAVNNGISYCGINLRWAIKSNEYYMSEKRGSWNSRNVAPNSTQTQTSSNWLVLLWLFEHWNFWGGRRAHQCFRRYHRIINAAIVRRDQSSEFFTKIVCSVWAATRHRKPFTNKNS